MELFTYIIVKLGSKRKPIPRSRPKLAGMGLLADYRLDDNLTAERGRILISGTQALVRVALMQARLDRARGWNTAGFVSGYRGSPLGGVDLALWKAQAL